MTFGLFCAIIFSASGLTDSLPLSDGGICRVIRDDLNEYTSVLRIESVDSGGAVRWTAEALPVRNDALSGLISESAQGGILFASAFGEGYTDILLQLFSDRGELLNADTVSLVCYDSPQALVVTENGFALAWDSWSEERGIHLAFISSQGRVVDTRFATGTVNPGPVALESIDGWLVLGVSPILAEDDVLFFYSRTGERRRSITPELPDEAQLIESIQHSETGTFSVVWKSLPDEDGNAVISITEHLL